MASPFFCYIAAFVLGAIPFACRRAPADAKTLRFHNMSEPRTLDPAGATGIAEKNLLLALAEGLTAADPVTGLPQPGVAERYETSDDGRTLTFHLRDCVWSNGDRIVAEDFRDSWLRVLDAATASPLAPALFNIRGAREFHEGRAPASGVAVRAADARTLVVEFVNPDPTFLQLCASSPLVPVHKSVAHAGFFVKSSVFVGNGPFVLEERVPNFRIVMKRNALYHDAKNVSIERIIAFATESRQTAVDSFLAGRSDWVDDFPTAQAASWIGRRELRTSPYLATYFLRFNITKPPFNDRRVREAIHLAIDRASICKNILKLGQRPAETLVPHCMQTASGYHAPAGKTYNPERARELLIEAGFPGGRGLPAIEYQYDTGEDNRRIAEAIQAMLRDNLNLQVFLINKEKKVHIDDEENLRYGGMSRGSWIADYVDPMSFLEIFESGSPANRTGFRSKEYDALLARARQASGAGRDQILREAEEFLVLREFPFTPIYEYVKQSLVNPNRIAGGFYDNPTGYHPMKWIRLREDR